LLIQIAVERQLEILGEAAGISEAFRRTHSEINWRKIVSLRNMLIHRYDEVQQDILWNDRHLRTHDVANSSRTFITSAM